MTDHFMTADDLEFVAKQLRGYRKGAGWMCCCPAHDDRSPSLSLDIKGGRLLTHCFSGCSPQDVWDGLKDYFASGEGLSEEEMQKALERQRRADRKHAEKERWKTQEALRIWREAVPAKGTPVETYLRSRAITIDVPQSLRYHPNVQHDFTGLWMPCMVAGVQAPDRKVIAIQRTFLAHCGTKKAGLRETKLSLGRPGAGAVRFGPPGPALGLAEGTETSLSAQEMFGMVTWSCCGTRFDAVDLPEEVKEVHFCADNPRPTAKDGGKAARSAVERGIERFTSEGRKCFVRRPPPSFEDWNDLAQAKLKGDAA
ncbi:toprim domain-containing protein [Pelagibius sp. Alg239-R121]|uniref:DUF7146 domain-containing protein n=1 Tax=Pelagibius sp. Alg239-R121 TaxID=2993448 RepID=UPI0024A6AB9D|nr:toprim domain-containing protein [Pelagibius sp. Alg239-R121]